MEGERAIVKGEFVWGFLLGFLNGSGILRPESRGELMTTKEWSEKTGFKIVPILDDK